MVATIAMAGGMLLLLVGTCFCALGTYGLLRMGDLYSRLHAASMVITLGATGIMLSLLLIGPPQAGIKGIATAVFFLFTGPLITHVLARTAHIRGIGTDEKMRDDLEEDQQRRHMQSQSPRD
jgi:multicomponent Na+:H+ antiporter subunit G